MNTKYNDIINFPHHVSRKHTQMTIEARAAQFAPFSALTGLEEQVKETARPTDEKIELDEEAKIILDRKLQILQRNLCIRPKVKFTYFVADERKHGGKYITSSGVIQNIDRYRKIIILENKKEIPIIDIIDMSVENNTMFI